MSEPVKFTLDEFVASLGDPHHPAVIEYMALRARIAELEAENKALREQVAAYENEAIVLATIAEPF